MRFKISFISIIFLSAIFIVCLYSTPVNAQTRDTTITTKSAMNPSGTKDTNVKKPMPVNNPKNFGKKETKSRSATTYFTVNNNTDWYVYIYVSGTYYTTVYAYGSITFSTYGDITSIYGKAPMSDGSYYYWGPASINNNYNYTYTWNLNY
jgi:hypothetical protein